MAVSDGLDHSQYNILCIKKKIVRITVSKDHNSRHFKITVKIKADKIF